MVAISLSGSGEGPGWVTAPGYSTAAFWLEVRVWALCPAPVRSGHILYRSPGTSFTHSHFP